MRHYALILLLAASALSAAEPADTVPTELDEVVVSTRRSLKKLRGATNTELISASELTRAACCNLGESFTTNPSVDVSYSDAATGARQIRLLGLSGQYVQMLTENLPNYRGAAAPYALGYVAGPWMQSIQVSKGASSVKNGYESIAGQINIEMKKPQADPSLSVNAYYDMINKLEANVDANTHLGNKWSVGALTHFENGFTSHDGNDDGFADIPRVRQVAAMPRVAYLGTHYVMQAAAKFVDERRRSGQIFHHSPISGAMPPYLINIDTRRSEFMTKNAWLYDRDNDGNIALMASGSLHRQDAAYGHRLCDIDQREAYAQLMYERKWADGLHALSSGISFSYDYIRYGILSDPSTQTAPRHSMEREAVGGAYAQYTLNVDDRLIAMAGMRYDYSDEYGAMVTPRMHLRYNINDSYTVHASAGRGYRSPHPMAEYNYILASSRRLLVSSHLHRESAWNMGLGASATLHIGGKAVTVSGEYYYTTFDNQLVLDLDSDAHAAIISSSRRPSLSHAVQAEVSLELTGDLTVTGAWRFTDVRVDYGHGMVEKPLTSRHKGLFTIGWAPHMGLWQMDASLAINGGGRMPEPYATADGALSWSPSYRAWPALNAQVTRNFRHWAVYIGGENITAYRQKNPIVDARNPWGPDFDATMIYGPLHGAMAYVGFRFNITKYI